MEEALKSGIHGFRSWVDFFKATIALGSMLTAGIYLILTTALDDRYGKVEDVRQNGETAKTVQVQLGVLSDVVIGEAVFAKKLQYCDAEAKGDTALKNELDRQLGVLLRQYKTLTGKEPYLPEC